LTWNCFIIFPFFLRVWQALIKGFQSKNRVKRLTGFWG
jgi:hypothetical protein